MFFDLLFAAQHLALAGLRQTMVYRPVNNRDVLLGMGSRGTR
jgi:hypothetical protein